MKLLFTAVLFAFALRVIGYGQGDGPAYGPPRIMGPDGTGWSFYDFDHTGNDENGDPYDFYISRGSDGTLYKVGSGGSLYGPDGTWYGESYHYDLNGRSWGGYFGISLDGFILGKR